MAKTDKNIKGSHVRAALRSDAADITSDGQRYMRLDMLCSLLSLVVNHDNLTMLEARLAEINVITEETEGEAAVTLIPWRSRVRYGLPETAESTERAPAESRAKRKDGTQSVAYYPIVALGNIVPDEPDAGTSTYDGRYDATVAKVVAALKAAGIEHKGAKGRMVRGGGGIYIALE